jgi:hypothetical protein
MYMGKGRVHFLIHPGSGHELERIPFNPSDINKKKLWTYSFKRTVGPGRRIARF